ncbi:MAG: flagellar hook-basal body complex protein FliE [Campylobacterota bacterium]|nr:flagellar hook-basal body complex protein FliE [Campylobacterota bacterium]
MKLAEITNSISSLGRDNISKLANVGSDMSQQANLQQNSGDSFSQILKDSIDDVNQNQVNAYNAMDEIATGKVDNLQEAVKKIEEAELSLKLGLEVKNKALGAYKQVMAMQV